MTDAEYEALLEKGRADTLDAPAGQLQGRAGRRCTLEDGERRLMRATGARPGDLRPHLLLLRNLMRQAMGREREVPGLALHALREAVGADGGAKEHGNGNISGSDEDGGGGSGSSGDPQSPNLHACSSDLLEDPSCMPALQLVLLALKALHAQQPPADVLAAAAAEAASATAASAASDVVDAWRARRLRAFVEAAGDAVPGLASEFSQVERRLRQQLYGPGTTEDARLRALVSREWLSAVDLAPPCGVVG